MKTILLVSLMILVSGCSQQAEKPLPANVPNIRTYCYEGIEYFGVWNNNAFAAPYLTGAVIDRKTMQPKVCE